MPDVLIQTFNEELNLPRTLESVIGWARKVFIVDSGSTDRTREIAEEAGATFVYHPWEGYAAQKNWAIDNLPWESDWILIVDADECVSPLLRQEIAAISARNTSEVRESGFYLNRMLIFMGRKIRHCGYFPSWNLRLFKRGRARYEQRLVHEHMIVDGPTGYLEHLLMHEDRRGLEHFAAKHNRYSTLEAQEIYESPEPWRGVRHFLTNRIARRRFIKTRITPNLPLAWLWRFFYMYFIRLGILDGSSGWNLCNFIASYELSIQLKVAELKRLHGKAGTGVHGLSVPEGNRDIAINSHTVRHSIGANTAPIDVGIPTFIGGATNDDKRFASPWTLKQNVGRVLWMLATTILFRPSFHNWYGFRNLLLRLFGAKIGKNVRIRPTAKIEIPWNLEIGDFSVIGDQAIIYSLGKITLGRCVVISQYAHLCAGTHDFRYRSFPLLKPPITIGNDAWIAADAFVGPGVVVGAGTVLGARSSAFNDLAPYQVCVGNPAKAVKARVLVEDSTGSFTNPAALPLEPRPEAEIISNAEHAAMNPDALST